MGESSRGLFRGFLFSRKGNKNQVTVWGFGGGAVRQRYLWWEGEPMGNL